MMTEGFSGGMETTTRQLLPVERRLLHLYIVQVRAHGSRLGQRYAVGVIAAAIGLVGLQLLFTGGPFWKFDTVLFLVGGAVLASGILFQSERTTKRSTRDLVEVLEKNVADVVHIRSHAMVQFEQFEDEGARYAFQLPDNRVVFVSGEDFRPTARFPNDDFSIVTVADDFTTGWIVKQGNKLAPLRNIDARAKRWLKLPGHLEVIEGRLEDLETLLSTAQRQEETNVVPST